MAVSTLTFVSQPNCGPEQMSNLPLIHNILPPNTFLDSDDCHWRRDFNRVSYMIRVYTTPDAIFNGFTGSIIYTNKHNKTKKVDIEWKRSPLGPVWTMILTNYPEIKKGSIITVTLIPV